MLAIHGTSALAQVESDYGHIEYQGTAEASYESAGNKGVTHLDWAAETTDYIELGAQLSFSTFTGTDTYTGPSGDCRGKLVPAPSIGTAFIPPNRYSDWLGVPIPPDTIALFVHFPSLGMQTDNPACAGGPRYAFDPNYNTHFPAERQQDFTNAFQAPVLLPIDMSDGENDYNFDYGPDQAGFQMHIHSVVRLSLLDPPPPTN